MIVCIVSISVGEINLVQILTWMVQYLIAGNFL